MRSWLWLPFTASPIASRVDAVAAAAAVAVAVVAPAVVSITMVPGRTRNGAPLRLCTTKRGFTVSKADPGPEPVGSSRKFEGRHDYREHPEWREARSDVKTFMTRTVYRNHGSLFVIVIGPVHHEIYGFRKK
jgi:hypothetical protein